MRKDCRKAERKKLGRRPVRRDHVKGRRCRPGSPVGRSRGRRCRPNVPSHSVPLPRQRPLPARSRRSGIFPIRADRLDRNEFARGFVACAIGSAWARLHRIVFGPSVPTTSSIPATGPVAHFSGRRSTKTIYSMCNTPEKPPQVSKVAKLQKRALKVLKDRSFDRSARPISALGHISGSQRAWAPNFS